MVAVKIIGAKKNNRFARVSASMVAGSRILHQPPIFSNEIFGQMTCSGYI
jgi:hypothetical protein